MFNFRSGCLWLPNNIGKAVPLAHLPPTTHYPIPPHPRLDNDSVFPFASVLIAKTLRTLTRRLQTNQTLIKIGRSAFLALLKLIIIIYYPPPPPPTLPILILLFGRPETPGPGRNIFANNNRRGEPKVFRSTAMVAREELELEQRRQTKDSRVSEICSFDSRVNYSCAFCIWHNLGIMRMYTQASWILLGPN